MGTETHYEFGSRVGVWRIVRMVEELGVPISVDARAVALERNPDVRALAARAAPRDDRPRLPLDRGLQLTRDAGARAPRLAIESVERTTGQRVPAGTCATMPSVNTRELLVEEGGFLYDSDASNDEIPYFVDVAGTPFLVVPYTKVYNDVKYFLPPTYARREDFFENLRGGLDYLLAEAGAGSAARMLTVGCTRAGAARRTARARCASSSSTPSPARACLHAPRRHRRVLDQRFGGEGGLGG